MEPMDGRERCDSSSMNCASCVTNYLRLRREVLEDRVQTDTTGRDLQMDQRWYGQSDE